jgi:hypothetical protein
VFILSGMTAALAVGFWLIIYFALRLKQMLIILNYANLRAVKINLHPLYFYGDFQLNQGNKQIARQYLEKRLKQRRVQGGKSLTMDGMPILNVISASLIKVF